MNTPCTQDRGSIYIRLLRGKFTAHTVYDGDKLRAVIGQSSFWPDQYDTVLARVSDMGFDLAEILQSSPSSPVHPSDVQYSQGAGDSNSTK